MATNTDLNVSVCSASALPDVGANAEIFEPNGNLNVEEFTKDFDPSALGDILGEMIDLSPHKDDKSELDELAKTIKTSKSNKPQTLRIIINDYNSGNEDNGQTMNGDAQNVKDENAHWI